jgi:hypothetical protein
MRSMKQHYQHLRVDAFTATHFDQLSWGLSTRTSGVRVLRRQCQTDRYACCVTIVAIDGEIVQWLQRRERRKGRAGSRRYGG